MRRFSTGRMWTAAMFVVIGMAAAFCAGCGGSDKGTGPDGGGVPTPTKTTFTDSRDNKTYKTVKIGSQTWMAENLNYNASGSVCYNTESSNCNTYGRLYNWATAMNLPDSYNSSSASGQIQQKHQGVCPAGWHIPTNNGWAALESSVGGSSIAGRKLKAQEGWYSCGPSGSGKSYVCEDAFGFAALPGGYGRSDGSFRSAGDYGGWWSASERGAYGAYVRDMGYGNERASWSNYDSKSYLFSVRCAQN